jgi:Tol biopolymer transport system component
LITSSTTNDSAQYSPDGNKIAFVSDRSGLAEIWIANADGSSPVQLTSSSGLPVGTPRWAPNGHQIVYDSIKDRVSVIYIIDSTGGTPRLLGDGRRDSMMPSWSRDGQFIYFVSKGAGDLMQVWKMPVEGGPAVQITTLGGGESVEAPDGKTLYYLKGERGVWQVPASGGMESLVPGLEKIGTSRYFAVTKRGMYFLAAENRPFNIYFYEFATRRMSLVGTIHRTPRFRTPSLSVSPDERWLIYAQEDQSGSDLTLLENVK